MIETFGVRLRRRREEQQIALITIAEQMKIKLSLLEALERDDVSHWPSGIYRRAFIRAYARAINLNPDVVVREFLEVHPDPEEVVGPASAIASRADGAPSSGAPPTRLRNLVGSALGSLSRLRRSPADPVSADRAPVDVSLHAEAHLSVACPPSPAPSQVEITNEVVAPAPCSPASEAPVSEPTVSEPPACDPDFLAVADLCTAFGRVENDIEVQPLLQEAARILDAIGVIVWLWDAVTAKLRPALAHGYSDKALALLPTVTRDADNATAAAFRSAEPCAIKGSDQASGALVVPLLTPAGCAGVLAFELQHGSEQTRPVRAVATIVAAQLAQLIGGTEVRPQMGDAEGKDVREQFAQPIH
jgi:transcriptional regulator with XRE-family HTH domain